MGREIILGMKINTLGCWIPACGDKDLLHKLACTMLGALE